MSDDRVTFVVDTTTFGGAETYVAQLLRKLPEGFSRSLVANPDVPAELRAVAEDVGAPLVVTSPARSKFDLVRLARQARAIRATRCTLVHLSLSSAVNIRHALASIWLMRLPAVATLHFVDPIRSTRQQKTLGYFFRRLSRVIAVSPDTRDQLTQDLGVDESLIRVVGNGVPHREPVVLVDRSPVRIAAVGRLTDHKGFDLLIEAVRRLVGEGIAVEAVIAGEGEDRAGLERQASGLPVTFPGFTPSVDTLLDTVDVFCLPSRREGLPFALLEAMMAGLPCVAAAVGGISEAVGTAAMVVPPEDVDALTASLRRLVLSWDERQTLGAAAHRRASDRLSLERMVADTVAVYDEVLSPLRP